MNRSRDWLNQARRDLDKAELDHQHKFYEWCCFTCQQAAEKAVKALFLHNNLEVCGHSIAKMLHALQEKVAVTEDLLDSAMKLDRYYIESQYLNGFPARSPFEFFSPAIADEALNDCRKIMGFVNRTIG